MPNMSIYKKKMIAITHNYPKRDLTAFAIVHTFVSIVNAR